jgi:DNA-binding NarL/FixJ family response regulator
LPLRCLIVDDNVAFLQAAGRLLERQGVAVVGLASNTADALHQVDELAPDVVLVDIVLGGESGLDAARELSRRNDGGPTVILISTHAEADFADLVDEASTAGFVPKAELSADAIRRLAG